MLNGIQLGKMAALLALSVLAASIQASEEYAPKPITKSERCPVCGMYPANYPKWHSQILFKDGEHSSFDSPIEMFRFVHNMAKYDKHHGAADIGMIYVPDAEKGSWLEARQAFFVIGSKARGPMGADLPAFASKESATDFINKSGGEMFTYQQVTPAMVEGKYGH
jgi:nitrous oxide reductase accessory protein NosL